MFHIVESGTVATNLGCNGVEYAESGKTVFKFKLVFGFKVLVLDLCIQWNYFS